MTTALFSHPACVGHAVPAGHPECPDRLRAIEGALNAPGFAGLLRLEAPEVAEAALGRAHDRAYLDALAAAIPARGLRALDADTHVGPGALGAARRAAGAVTAAVDLVMGGGAANAFCAVRPPGHHAERARAMGFCLYANAAIGALHALDHHGAGRVAVVDFDVHHGNGTQDVLWHERRALFFSSHQMPLWPGTGEASEQGAHGQIVNLPLAPGSDGAAMRALYAAHVLPRLRAFAPDLIIVSAGFDAHRADPLAGLRWVEGDFAWLTRAICAVARDVCAGRVVSVLEGGYDLPSLGASVAAHVAELIAGGAG